MRFLHGWGWETAVFRVATGAALLHALDDAFVNRQPGVQWDQHWLAALISVAAAAAAVFAFPSLRPGLRAGVSFGVGLLATVNGALHVIHITKEGPAASDLTGVLAFGAGVFLIALAIWIPLAAPRRAPADTRSPVGQPRHRARRRRARGLCLRFPDQLGDHPNAQVSRADRLAAERGVPDRVLRVIRRARALRLVPPVP